MTNKYYIIAGKAASGKDFLQKKMKDLGYRAMKQYTTRPVRDSERGDEYYFKTISEYKKLEGSFFSSNFYAIGWYGISIYELIGSDVAILSPANIKDLFEKYPHIRKFFDVVYIDTPIEVRRERLAKRYSSKVDDDNERRIKTDEIDFQDFNDWDIKLCSEDDINNFVNKLSPIDSTDRENRNKRNEFLSCVI